MPKATFCKPSHKAPAPKWGFMRWLLIAFIIICLDQASKYYFNNQLHFAERWHILPFFDFTLLYNKGAAFSFLANGAGWQRWFFTSIAFIATWLIISLLRKHPNQPLFCSALSLILGGAIGNVIDRLAHGHVIDFLLFYWNSWYFPAFNVADIAITIGAILLIVEELLRVRKSKKNQGI